jgi:hypothetical protein
VVEENPEALYVGIGFPGTYDSKTEIQNAMAEGGGCRHRTFSSCCKWKEDQELYSSYPSGGENCHGVGKKSGGVHGGVLEIIGFYLKQRAYA